MFIIWGTRAYFRTKQVNQYGFCANCNRFAKFESYNARNFFHLYFVPLIPLESRKRYHKACSKCETMRTLSLEESEIIANEFKQQSADALLAILSHETTFVSDNAEGEPVEAIPFLFGAMDWLYACNQGDYCTEIVEQLQKSQFQYASNLVSANLETIKGQLDTAIANFEEAHKLDKQNDLPLRLKADLLDERKRGPEAIAAYQASLALTTDPNLYFTMSCQLAECQLKYNDFRGAAETFEQVLKAKPELFNDKKLMKKVQKARKKAGLPTT